MAVMCMMDVMEVMEHVASLCRQARSVPFVCDPVLITTSGTYSTTLKSHRSGWYRPPFAPTPLRGCGLSHRWHL